jgi:formylglycine-generating enzyme required for sulfatase activity
VDGLAQRDERGIAYTVARSVHSYLPPLPLNPERLATIGFVPYRIGESSVIIPPLASIPAGSFLMGSSSRDRQAYDDEKPQHEVSLESYEIGIYPVTVAEYACFVQSTGYQEPKNSGSVTWKKQQEYGDHPVVCVSWEDALAYVQWLASITAELWRLPTEAEWEKAARGTDGRRYPWGNRWDKTKANTNEGGPKTTTPVGTYSQGASPYGCFDMSGNMWEWTNTLFQNYPYKATDGREDTTTQGSRVLRGGSWDSGPRGARGVSQLQRSRRLVPRLRVPRRAGSCGLAASKFVFLLLIFFSVRVITSLGGVITSSFRAKRGIFLHLVYFSFVFLIYF